MQIIHELLTNQIGQKQAKKGQMKNWIHKVTKKGIKMFEIEQKYRANFFQSVISALIGNLL